MKATAVMTFAFDFLQKRYQTMETLFEEKIRILNQSQVKEMLK
jgi:hypothetical protein